MEEKKNLKYVLNNIELACSIFILAVTFFVLTLQIIFRLTGVQNAWTDELSRYLFIWLTYLGAGVAMQRDEHVRIDILNKVWPKPLRKPLERFGLLISLAFCFVALYFTTVYTLNVRANGQISGGLGISMFVPYLAVNVGYVSVIIRMIQYQIIPEVKLMFSGKKKRKEMVTDE